MIMVSSILGALLVAGAYYGTIWMADKRTDLELRKNGRMIVSNSVLLTGSISFLVMVWLGSVSFWAIPLSETVLQYVLIWGMSVLAVIDHKKHVIPNRLLLFLTAVWTAVAGAAIIRETAYGMALLFQSLAGALAGGLIFLFCYVLSRRQLGAGDVKLAFVMGLYLTGQRIIGAVFYGIIACFFYSVIQLIRKKIGLKDGIPLVPFLYIGVLITLCIMSAPGN